MRTKFIIHIDRSTIRENPRYLSELQGGTMPGMKSVFVQDSDPRGQWEAEYESVGVPKVVLDETNQKLISVIGKFVAIRAAGHSVGAIPARGMPVMSRDALKMTFRPSQHTRIEFRTEAVHVSPSLHPRRWIFKYLPDKVRCEHCNQSFPHTDLETSDDSDYTPYVCPKCHEFDPCDVEYEDIEEVMAQRA